MTVNSAAVCAECIVVYTIHPTFIKLLFSFLRTVFAVFRGAALLSLLLVPTLAAKALACARCLADAPHSLEMQLTCMCCIVEA